MKKRFFLLIPFLFNIYLGVSHAQIIKKDRVAIFYIYCERYFNESTQKEEAMPQDLLVSQEELEKHLIGDPNTKDDDGYIPGNGSPISNFFAVNFNNHYQYRGKVFRVPLPLSEKEFNEAPENSWFSQNLISALREKQGLAWPKTPNMKVDGFLQEDFDLVILLLGESSLFKAGSYSIAKYFDSYDHEHKININNTLLDIPSISGKSIKPSSEDFEMYGGPYGPNGQFGPSKYYPEFDLWNRSDQTLLHEWGHHLGAFHSTSPCANEDCRISSDNQYDYGTTCSDYFNFNCSENLVFNGRVFGLSTM